MLGMGGQQLALRAFYCPHLSRPPGVRLLPTLCNPRGPTRSRSVVLADKQGLTGPTRGWESPEAEVGICWSVALETRWSVKQSHPQFQHSSSRGPWGNTNGCHVICRTFCTQTCLCIAMCAAHKYIASLDPQKA